MSNSITMTDYCDDCNAPMVWCVCDCCDSCGNFLCSCNDPYLNPDSSDYGKVLMKVKCEDCERELYFFNEDEADYLLSNHDCEAY